MGGQAGQLPGQETEYSELVTQGDGSRAARPQLGLKEVRTDGIQRCPQKGFLSTPTDFNSFLLRAPTIPHWRHGPAASPRVTTRTQKESCPTGPHPYDLFFLKTGFEIQILPHGQQCQPGGPCELPAAGAGRQCGCPPLTH